MANQDLSGRGAARARRDAQIKGKAAQSAKTPVRVARTPRSRIAAATAASSAPVEAVVARPASISAPVARSVKAVVNSGREASRKRRLAMSSRGKSGISSNDRQRQEDARRRARAAVQKKDCGCGCEGRGDCGDAGKVQAASATFVAPKATSAVRRSEVKVVSAGSAGRINSKLRRQAMSLHGKTGEASFGKGVSSAQIARQQNPGISGRDLARTVRTQRSNSGAAAESARRSAPVGRRRPAKPADEVSGTKVSHSEKTTGDETGLCRSVTGTDYFSSEVFDNFCQNEAPVVPGKVRTSENLSGSSITASGEVGRSAKVSGDERGSCKIVTGVEYVGREQYDDFCTTKPPEPGNAKVSFSQTARGLVISGSKPARSQQVSGNEAGTCKSVTGTPYAGMEQFQEYCKPAEAQLANARSQKHTGNGGQDVTGLQPGFDGLTGASQGACSSVSGTAYVSAEQQQSVCGAMPAQMNEPDFPKPLTDSPWGSFSVISAPVHASQPQAKAVDNVTGSRYEQGRVSGAFSLGEGKITGTEQFRFGGGVKENVRPVATTPVDVASAVPVKRVTGEGNDSGLKITGNDWGRGDHVTGTEGTSSVKRNPTRRGPVSAMPSSGFKRNEDVERGMSNVTGGTGGTTEKGALVTLSGGARG